FFLICSLHTNALNYYEELYWLVRETNFSLSDLFDMTPSEKDFFLKYHTEILDKIDEERQIIENRKKQGQM
ncbi:hypothetical protein, partial [Propionibacterium freudenreichii]|uniref:hypothetical protein n=1 Tax=Propionibacterium freudenreichii TaxID=1744 RepID=UPI00385558CC